MSASFKWHSRVKYILDSYPFGPHEEKRDEQGLLHAVNGPAYISPTRVMWMEHGKKHGADIDIFGSISYYYNDIAVPAKFVLQPDTVTFDEVVQHPNVEVRYVGLRIIGYEKLMEKAKFIHSDKERNMDLFQLKVDETSTPVTLLRVVNSTPDPDGTYKNYFLSVPSDMTNCQQAVAWTFGMQPDEYHPQMET